ncbi:MAG TPA: 3-oxoacyl-ACP synthase [Actinomycetes bacterium]|jgi:3-oxoacyl-[acyl-carrier-protein] synthase-3|nr:3-oxoacyl-ACP synthase [Actinomycetes bacterium]
MSSPHETAPPALRAFAGAAASARAPAPVGLVATAAYLPSGWSSAAEIAAASGIPEPVIVAKFGLRGKHIAAEGEHVSDLSARAGAALLDETGVDPATVDAVVYFGSTWKDYPVWQAAPRVAYLLGCERAFALELDYVSCGAPVALRVARDLLAAEDALCTVLIVAASRESQIVDYANPRARFMFPFGDGAVAGLLVRGERTGEILGSHMITDGSLAQQVRMPAGGSVEPASHASVSAGRHALDVADPAAMKERLGQVSLTNFLAAAEGAAKRSGIALADIDYVCGIHMKPSMHEAILDRLGVPAERAAYLDDTGHMSGVDPLLAYDRGRRSGAISDGALVLVVAAGTGYSWAATVLRAGRQETS